MAMLTRTLIYLITLLFVASCGTLFSPEDEPHPSIESIQDPAEKAKQLEIQGYYKEAAHEYLRIAAQMRPPTQQGYQLSAIKSFLAADMLTEAKAELARLDVNQSYGLEIPIEFVKIKIDLAEQRVDQALQQLEGIDLTTLPAPLQIEYKQLRAQIRAATGEILEAAHEWIEIDELSKADPNQLSKNHRQLWQALVSYELSDIQAIKQVQGDIFSGWVALALLTKTVKNRQLQPAINNWQLRFPNHPAISTIIPTLVANRTPTTLPPKQIALLLPLSGKFGSLAEAIKNGFIAVSNTENPTIRPQVTIHEVNTDNILQVYQQAVDDGTEFVVGPLEKEALAVLAKHQTQLPIPTLGLNHLETPVITGNLYQFSLSPEDEAQEVAHRAWSDGHRSALVLVPDGEWGERLLKAFQKQWEHQGGTIALQQMYGNKFKSSLPQLLSNATTVDMVFLVAFPQLARKILPLLHTYLDNRIPIYSTSHVYSGTSEVTETLLDGIMFVDMPWVLAPDAQAIQLQATLQQSWPNEVEKLKRLHALGVDAYKILPQLQQVNRQADFQWQGQTGHLFLNKLGEIHRNQLRWARFVNGIPQLIEANSH